MTANKLGEQHKQRRQQYAMNKNTLQTNGDHQWQVPYNKDVACQRWTMTAADTWKGTEDTSGWPFKTSTEQITTWRQFMVKKHH